ncbi:hypothetical protein EAO79_06510 [Plantibacter sp. PA-3-X8]|nr:hypothetical protein EAO79_06510 [Plantibacter sp. PA-3-X8]
MWSCALRQAQGPGWAQGSGLGSGTGGWAQGSGLGSGTGAGAGSGTGGSVTRVGSGTGIGDKGRLGVSGARS